MGCCGTISSLLVVGFSSSFWLALSGRILGGILNGNIGVIQTMVGELVKNPDHERALFALLSLAPCVLTAYSQSIRSHAFCVEHWHHCRT